jgi:hypothetical protein
VFQHPKYVDIFLTCFKQFQNQNTFLIHRCSTKTILVFARKKTFEKSSVTLSIIPFLKESQLIPLTLYIKIYKTDQRVGPISFGKYWVILYNFLYFETIFVVSYLMFVKKTWLNNFSLRKKQPIMDFVLFLLRNIFWAEWLVFIYIRFSSGRYPARAVILWEIISQVMHFFKIHL